MASLRVAVIASLIQLAFASSAESQITVALGLRSDRYFGSAAIAQPDGGVGVPVRPLRPDVAELSVHRKFGVVTLGLVGAYFKTGFAGESEDVVIQPNDIFNVKEVAIEAGLSLTPQVRVSVGPIISTWNREDVTTQTVFGAQLAVDFEAGLGGGFSAYGRVAVAALRSPFPADQLEPDQVGNGLRRRGLSAGIRLAL